MPFPLRVGLKALLPQMPALFMTSLIRATGHKMAAPTVMFSLLSHVDF